MGSSPIIATYYLLAQSVEHANRHFCRRLLWKDVVDKSYFRAVNSGVGGSSPSEVATKEYENGLVAVMKHPLVLKPPFLITILIQFSYEGSSILLRYRWLRSILYQAWVTAPVCKTDLR